ncbi:HEAT repeat domain-containing protein [Candidatus Deferrimicrobium sp.]|uniref:HEAT repeat domain-containing protein n=1 Tax=Candidatus Deferrimicrobium sp. TaxID=3060586 RepID=UPI003C36C95D
MEVQGLDTGSERIEQLLLDIARVHHWTGLYAPRHPILAGRIDALRASLSGEARREPSGMLLLGIARDRVLFRDRFLGGDLPLVSSFTEVLYRRHVATLGIAEDVTAGELSVFFRCLHDLRSGKIDDPPEEYLLREGIRGIRLSPVNYKEVLSRGILAAEAPARSEPRQEAIWRTLLSAHLLTEDDERKIMEELAEFPELLSLIMKRAVEAAAAESAPPSDAGGPSGFISPDVLRRMFRRLGRALKALPEKRRKGLLGHLVKGIVPSGTEAEGPVPEVPLAIARSMAEGYSDREFLELLASLLSLEEKGGKRLLRIFEILAAERDVEGSLLPLLRTWKRENLREKKYFAAKTWEAIERLLLERGEKAYVEKGHAAFIEKLSTSPGKIPDGAPGDEFAPSFSEAAIRRRGLAVLVELLLSEKRDPDFLTLLAALEEGIPRLIDDRDFELLDRVLSSFLHASESGAPARSSAANDALRSVDFLRIVDAILATPDTLEEEKGGADLLSNHGVLAAEALLRKLQDEEEPGRRKILLSLVLRLGEKAVPSILSRIQGQRWFFLRNLCFLLGEIGSPAGIPALVGMLSARELKVRREAVQALGKIRMLDPDAIAVLGRMLLHQPLFSSAREDAVRIDAAIALSRIGGTEAIAFLHVGKSSRKKAVREQCEALLRARGTE